MRIRKALLLVAFSSTLVFVPKASADAMGTLSILDAPGGAVTVTTLGITFSGGIVTTIATNLSSSGGTLGSGVSGTIENVTFAGALPLTSFMTFGSLQFDLTSLGPGVPNTDCATLTPGNSCSVVSGSPFLLVDTPAGATSDTTFVLALSGTVTDSTGTSAWVGKLNANLIGLSPAQVQSQILGGGSTFAYAGEFIVTPNAGTPTPEPSSLLLLGTGLVGMLGAVRRKLIV